MQSLRTVLGRFWDALWDDASYTRAHRVLFDGHTGLVLILLLVAGLSVCIRIAYVPLVVNSDTTQYVQTAQHLAGEDTGIAHGNRLLKPLAPLALTTLTPYLEGNYYAALEVTNIFFYYLLAVLIYFFAYHFLHSRREAFIAALLYTTSYPMLMYGLDLYTETGAWFFHLLGLYYAVRYYRTPFIKYVTLSALATTAGFLWKEYTALSGLALGILILLAQTPWKTKLGHLVVAAVLALPLLVGWQVHVYQAYQYTYLDWFKLGHGELDATSQFSLFYIGKSLFALLLLGWLFVAGGFLKWRTFAREDRVPALVVTLTSLGFLAWGYVSSRLYFVLAPVLAVFAGRGSVWLSTGTLQTLLVGAVVAANYAWLIIANTPAIRAWLVAL